MTSKKIFNPSWC